jgi:S-DNA-T family DNA segregation ATPase FtsK/SpoIIIE
VSSSKLAAGKTLELVDTLKGAIEAFADRADKLDGEFHSHTAKERQRGEAAVAEQRRQVMTALGEAEAALETAQTATRSKHERRKVWIGKAYQSSKHRALQNIDDRTGGRKYELQKTMLQAERDRDAGLAAAATAFEEFRKNLATEQETLARSELAAQHAFGGYPGFRRLFLGAYGKAEVDRAKDDGQLLSELRGRLAKAGDELVCFNRFWLLRLFKYLPVWILLVVCEAPLIFYRSGLNTGSYYTAGGAVVGSLALIFAFRFIARRQAAPLAVSLSNALAQARRIHDVAYEKSEARRQQETERIKGGFQATTTAVDQRLKRVLAEAGESRVSKRMESDERAVRASARNDQILHARLERLEREHTEATERLKQAAEVRIKSLAGASEERQKKFAADYQVAWQALATEWKSRIEPIYGEINSSKALAEQLFPPWQAPEWKNWSAPRQFNQTAKFAQLNIALEKLCQAVPKDGRLALPGPSRLSLPLCLAYPEQGSILLETGATGHDEAIATLNNIVLRLLSTAPPGRVNFTILDPVGLGQNFAGIMHLADYEEMIINSRIWTQSGQIEQKLADLNEHLEKVIQMYLRNEYATIAEYNEQAGVIAEKYHFLVVADFPANFTDVAAKRLLSIAASGAKCGVYMLLHWDHRQAVPQEFIPDELRKSCVCLSAKDNGFVLTGKSMTGVELALDAPPTPEFAIDFVNQVGRASRDSGRVEVPFAHVAPPEAEIWSEETTSELRVPIGRTGATKLQYLAIGKGTCQHGLIAGKTGSGKSTLFHVIITNLALWCSPEQVEFYLVDFKKGVEFKCYASRRLPHARVVAIESDREFGLSVLQRVDDELKRRGDLFRQLGVQDIAGYKRAGGAESIPRSLLLIDEFQEFFVEEDRVSQYAATCGLAPVN